MRRLCWMRDLYPLGRGVGDCRCRLGGVEVFAVGGVVLFLVTWRAPRGRQRYPRDTFASSERRRRPLHGLLAVMGIPVVNVVLELCCELVNLVGLAGERGHGQ